MADVFTVTAEHASSVTLESGEQVLELQGNVQVTDDQVTVASDSAKVYQQSEKAEFYGNVQAESDTLSAEGRFLSYSRLTGVMVLSGNAVLTDGNSILTADQVDWFRFRDKATAKGSVVLQGDWLGNVAGEYALYDRERGSLFVTVDPVLTRVEENDTTVITADRLEFFQDGERAEAQGNAVVSMSERDVTASSEYLRYYGEEERMELIGSPVINAEDGQLFGDWMEGLTGSDGGLEFLRIEGAASGHMEQDSTLVDFNSQRAEFAFTGSGDLDSLLLQGSAVLNIFGEDSVRTEANTIHAENITILFSDGEAEQVKASGTVRGTYSWTGEMRD